MNVSTQSHINVTFPDIFASAKPAGLAQQAIATVSTWRARRRQRAVLTKVLTQPHMLQDLGISRHDAEVEAAKPFWRD